jgi:hypothetical protein
MLSIRSAAAIAVLTVLSLGYLACHFLGLWAGLAATPVLLYLTMLALGRGGVRYAARRGKAISPVVHFAPYPRMRPPWEDSEDKARFPWVSSLKEASPRIRTELSSYVAAARQFRSEDGILSNPGRWKSILLFPREMEAGLRSQFPETCRALDSIPGIVNYSFLRLEGKSTVKPHHGQTDAVVRCHLGVTIPGSLPDTAMEVDGEPRAWGEGEVLLFNDAYLHTAYNGTDKPRDILIFDVWRPELGDDVGHLEEGQAQLQRILSMADKAPFISKYFVLVFLLFRGTLLNWEWGRS